MAVEISGRRIESDFPVLLERPHFFMPRPTDSKRTVELPDAHQERVYEFDFRARWWPAKTGLSE